MKYIDEFRDPKLAENLIRSIQKITTRKWTLMEVCGGQTHSIIRFGIDQVLPSEIELLHGPGCPVCVTPAETLDLAFEIASRPEVIFCTFGDMLRVPGSEKADLMAVKAKGADIRMVYSPLDVVEIARQNPTKEVVFFAVGFETTAPAHALSVETANREGLANFSLLVSHVLVPPALEALLNSDDNRVQAFLAAGHVCTIMGYKEYESLCDRYKIPIVVTGFEPLDILEGIYLCIKQLEEGRALVENQYARSVRREGNPSAMNLVQKIFEITNRSWRGLGEIPLSGLKLRDGYKSYDAELRFLKRQGSQKKMEAALEDCISGEILRGNKKPFDCPNFGRKCTPESPFGATMVSTEGACAAYYRYRREDYGMSVSHS
jgi:hydrogenase expression/formation protein HypD